MRTSLRCWPRSRTAGSLVAAAAGLAVIFAGCAQHQYSHLLASNDADMVGSHEAGAATWNPLVEESVVKLLERCPPAVQPVHFDSAAMTPEPLSASDQTDQTAPVDAPVVGSALASGPATVCFVGIENKSAEELVDFKDQIYETIDSQINAAGRFRSISRRMVEAALRQTRLRPDSLFLPENRDLFAATLGRQGTPVDYLMYATITSGTTDRNKSTQRDYVLTLEMVNLHSGEFLKESAKIRKGYHGNRTGRWWNYGPLAQSDG